MPDLALADLRLDFTRSINPAFGLDDADFGPIAAALAAMEAKALDRVRGEADPVGVPRLGVTAEMRDPSQADELSVRVPDALRPALGGATGGTVPRRAPAPLRLRREDGGGSRQHAAGLRRHADADYRRAALWHGGNATVFLADRWVEADLHDRATLAAGTRIAGPAVVAQPDTTVLVRPG